MIDIDAELLDLDAGWREVLGSIMANRELLCAVAAYTGHNWELCERDNHPCVLPAKPHHVSVTDTPMAIAHRWNVVKLPRLRAALGQR